MFITLNHRMFMATADAKYIDVMERGMYNNAIDGVSASGNRFFYVNRLASAGDGRDTRWERASLECCPPNLVRFLASMPGLIYAQDKDDAIYVNLYVSSEASFKVGGEGPCAGGRERDAVGRKIADQGVGQRRRSRAPSSCAFPAGPGTGPLPGALYSYADKVDRQAYDLGQRQERQCRAGRERDTCRSIESGATGIWWRSNSRSKSDG